MAVLLGLALVGCGDKEEDTAYWKEPITQPAYGAAEEEPEASLRRRLRRTLSSD